MAESLQTQLETCFLSMAYMLFFCIYYFFDTGIIRTALLGYIKWRIAGWSDFSFLSGCGPVGHQRTCLAADLAPLANGWKVEAITSTHASCPHLIKPHGVGVNPTGWGLLANLMRATSWGPWRMDYRRLHEAEERDIHTGGYSLPLRPAFLAFPCVQLPWNLCWIPARIFVTRLGTWLRYRLN